MYSVPMQINRVLLYKEREAAALQIIPIKEPLHCKEKGRGMDVHESPTLDLPAIQFVTHLACVQDKAWRLRDVALGG
ncbi:hypothetical protein KTH_10890 [Thermosporothrix hazakensis]|nr:hypothetical protein KTH_10890 [Thermosporothrix hazakensis]